MRIFYIVYNSITTGFWNDSPVNCSFKKKIRISLGSAHCPTVGIHYLTPLASIRFVEIALSYLSADDRISHRQGHVTAGIRHSCIQKTFLRFLKEI